MEVSLLSTRDEAVACLLDAFEQRLCSPLHFTLGFILALLVLVYEGDTGTRGTGLFVAHPKAPTKIAATGATQGAAGAAKVVNKLAGAPLVATHFKQAMAAVQAMGTTSMREVFSP